VRVEDGPTHPTLAEAGIDKHLADRARKAAAVPAEEFEKVVDEARDKAMEGAEFLTQISEGVQWKSKRRDFPRRGSIPTTRKPSSFFEGSWA
jgi:hypothetical protein